MKVEIRDPMCSIVFKYSGTACWTRNPLFFDSDHERKAREERTMLIPGVSVPTRYSASSNGAPALIQHKIFTGRLRVSKVPDMSHKERCKETRDSLASSIVLIS